MSRSVSTRPIHRRRSKMQQKGKEEEEWVEEVRLDAVQDGPGLLLFWRSKEEEDPKVTKDKSNGSIKTWATL